ncbi:MAG: asparagine synthase (glutamine-hydrolyzing) [Candidatus Hydrogenedens sp.]|nr:asparagine synthase (glutamine-hydrolyzing) [Candidatus Hydrogenedens sp.]
MCGISGLHGAQDDGAIQAMNHRLRHRGPDGEGVYRDRPAGLALAQRRLAIIDVAGGRQPMSTPDGRYTLVYNGELYNAPELRQALEAAGEAFATDHSDTEVLLKLLVREGPAALERLNGMFAFCLYDRDAGTLLLARDRFGIKPLYYADLGGRFVFASELKSILALPWVPRDLDRASLFHFMSLMYVPGTETILQGIRRLGPGQTLTYRLAERSLRLDQALPLAIRPDHSVPARAWPERLRVELAAAVRRWTLADVPVACSLSGGLDSAAIVGLLAEGGIRLKTFSVGFTGAGEADWNELPLARAVAERWGTDHHELVLEPEALLDDLVAMVWHLDEPYGGGLPSWLVFKEMARTVKVGLTGTGGDELFGHYGKWRPLEGGPLARLWPRAFAPAVDAARFERDFVDRCYYLGDADKRRLVLPPEGMPPVSTGALLYRRYAGADGPSLRDRAALTDLGTQLPEEFLMMTDRFSMAHSLEARTPFLDAEFARLALSVPAGQRTRRRDLKGLLRRAVAPVLPVPLLTAPKRGFVIPLRLWLRGRLRPLAERLLSPSRLAAQGLFRPEFYQAYVRPHLDGEADHTNRVWAALMVQLWHLVFLERSGEPDFTLADLLA